MGVGQCDKATVAIRVRTIQEWLLQGYTTKDIKQQGMTSWNVSDRQIHRYLAEARKWFLNETKQDIANRRAFHIEARMRIFKNLKMKDGAAGASTALGILRDIAELEGLYVKKIAGPDGEPLLPFDPLAVKDNKLIISVISHAANAGTVGTASQDTDLP